MLTRLQAVNQLLGRIRERSISSLDEPLNEDSREALVVLDQVSRQVQMQGYAFNSEENVVLPLNTAGECRLSANSFVANADESEWPHNLSPVQRGGRMFNRVANSYIFTEPVRLKRLIKFIVWEELPPVAQRYIAALSEIEFTHRSNGDERALELAQRAWRLSDAEFSRVYIYDTNPNIFNGPDLNTIIGRNRWAR